MIFLSKNLKNLLSENEEFDGLLTVLIKPTKKAIMQIVDLFQGISSLLNIVTLFLIFIPINL